MVFRRDVTLPEKPRGVALFLRSLSGFKATVNGHAAGAKGAGFQEFDRQDVTEFIVSGKNSIEVTVKTDDLPAHAAAVAGLVKIVRSDGSIERIPTDANWRTEQGPAAVIASTSPSGVQPHTRVPASPQ